MASHYMCIMNYACYKDDLQDAKHMVTYIICFTFATRTPLDIRSAYSADCGLRPNQGQDALAGSSCSRRAVTFVLFVVKPSPQEEATKTF